MTIYRLRRKEIDPALSDAVSRLEEAAEVEVTEKRVPAVAGQLAGEAIQILLSDPVQAFTTAAEIGALIWGIIKAARAAGKHLSVGPKEAKAMAASESKEKVDKDPYLKPEPLIWGPMVAVPEDIRTEECTDEESPWMFLTAFVFP